MKTLDDFKARLAPGVELLCIAHTAFPGFVGKVRHVTHAQRDGFWWRSIGEGDHLYWTRFPAASRCQILDENTIVLPARYQTTRFQVTLRFVRDAVPTLTPEDWAEIYAALETKHALVAAGHYGPEDTPGQDSAWATHLQRIMNTIGPDGAHMTPPETSA